MPASLTIFIFDWLAMAAKPGGGLFLRFFGFVSRLRLFDRTLCFNRPNNPTIIQDGRVERLRGASDIACQMHQIVRRRRAQEVHRSCCGIGGAIKCGGPPESGQYRCLLRYLSCGGCWGLGWYCCRDLNRIILHRTASVDAEVCCIRRGGGFFFRRMVLC
jgi:hypothetical protein